MQAMTKQESFTEWLQREMEKRGWNQAELSRRSGVTTAQVSRINTGEQRPGPTVCRAFARALQLPPEEVFRRVGLLPPTHIHPEGTEEIVYHYVNMSFDDRIRLLAFARILHQMKDE